VSAAFVERILGLGFASFGTGGGGAAVWGAAASGDIDIRSAGIETGGELGRAGDVVLVWPLGRPDIIARRVRTVEGRHGTRKDDRQTRRRDIGNQERWWWWYNEQQTSRAAALAIILLTNPILQSHCSYFIYILYIKYYPVSCT
jgi:hypothetical protein